MCAVDADHENCGQSRHLDRDPHQTDIVRDQRQIHPEHHDLVHRVVESQIGGSQPADFQLMRDIGCAEHARGEADERAQHDENDVQIIDQEIRVGRRMLDEQGERRQQCGETGQHVHLR